MATVCAMREAQLKNMVLTDEERMLRESAQDFCTQVSPVSAFRALRDASAPDGYDPRVWRQMAELGWMGIPWPEEAGGAGLGYRGLGLVSEQIGRTLLASPLHSTLWVCGSAINMGAAHDLKQKLLPRLADGNCLFALALEESAHHAPYGARLALAKRNGGLVLEGAKRFVADGGVADYLLVVARSSGEPGDRDGLTLLVVPRETRGITSKPLSMVDSRHMVDIKFEGVQLPDSGREILGEAGRGAEVLDPVLDRARIGLAAEMLGISQELFDRTIDYLKERKQFGVPIGSFQALKHRAADMMCEVELARSALFEALTALDDARDEQEVRKLASLAKSKIGETLKLVSRESLQMHGGIGMTDEFDIGLFLKRAAVCEQQYGNAAFHADRYAELGGF